MKNNKIANIIIIIIFLLIATALTVGLVAAISGHDIFNRGEAATINHEITDDVTSLELSWDRGDVVIQAGDYDKIYIEHQKVSGEKDLALNVSDGALSIDQNTNWFFGFGFLFNNSPKIIIHIPTKDYEKISVKSTSGDISISNINTKEMYTKVTSGKMNVTNISSDTYTLKLTSGTVNIKDCTSKMLDIDITSGSCSAEGEYQEINLKNTSGNIDITDKIVPNTINSKTTSGKVVLSIPENDGFSFELDKTSGSFDSDFDLMHGINDEIYHYIKADGNRKYYAKMTSGDIVLNKNSY